MGREEKGGKEGGREERRVKREGGTKKQKKLWKEILDPFLFISNPKVSTSWYIFYS